MSEDAGRRCPGCGRHFAFPGEGTDVAFRQLGEHDQPAADEVVYLHKCGARLACRHVDRAPQAHRLVAGK